MRICNIIYYVKYYLLLDNILIILALVNPLQLVYICIYVILYYKYIYILVIYNIN